MLEAHEAWELTQSATPGRERAEADTLAASALKWAMKNAIGQTEARIETYAAYGRDALSMKFAPGEANRDGDGNAFYNDLLANSNALVADAIADIIYGREQSVISPIQTARLLNDYNAKLVHFIRTLRRLGYKVRTGTRDDGGHISHDNSTIIISWNPDAEDDGK